MITYGEVLKRLRLEQGLSLKQVASEDVSVSQLSRFERGESDLSATKLFQVLATMQIEVADFVWLIKNYQKSDEYAFMSKLTPLYYAKDIAGLQALQTEQTVKMKMALNPLRHQLNSILVQAFLHGIDSRITVSEQDLTVVADYLFQVENWQRYELILFGNLYSNYSVDYVYRMGRELLEKDDVMQVFARDKSLLRLFILNFWLHCVEHKAFEEAAYFEKKVRPMLGATAIYEKTIYLYTKGLETYQKGQKQAGIEQMQSAIQVFQVVDASEQATYYQEHFDRFVGKE